MAKQNNRFVIYTTAAAGVMILVVVAVVVFLNGRATTFTGDAPNADNVNPETGAITIGDGSVRIDTWVDFMCPGCGAFESRYGEHLVDLADGGKITLTITAVAALDRVSQGTEYSTRSANALYCVAEQNQDAVIPFFQSLFENQPAEGTAGLDDETLIQLAAVAGAEDAGDCIRDRPYDHFVEWVTEGIPASTEDGRRYTPGVLVDGEYIVNPNGNDDFMQLLDGLVQK